MKVVYTDCEHADFKQDATEIETRGLGHWPTSAFEAIEVCQKCVSWRFVGEEKWRGAYE